METRRLGRTEHHSTVAILGGAAFARVTPEQAEAGFALAREAGLNHLDIAPRYGDAEVLVGPLLAPVRDAWFVAAKTAQPDRDNARRELERTLERLRTDHLDLYQLHGVTGIDVLDERAGAVEVLLAARDEGLTRFLGITGHDLSTPRAQLEALRRYDLDTVMFPVYPTVWADPVYRADATALLDEAARRDVGVMVIKAVARQPWGAETPSAHTWYRPWTEPEAIAAGVEFALSTPGVCGFCTPGDLGLLPAVLAAAQACAPLSDEQRAAACREHGESEIIFPLLEKFRR